jgi:hypothetical protein
MDVLDEITRQRREDVALSKEHISEEELKEQITSLESSYGPPLDVLKRLNMPSVSH